MINHLFRTLQCGCFLMLALSSAAFAQAQQAQSGELPRTSDGKPDFSGFWSQPRHVEPRAGGGATTFTKEKMPAFVPGGEALFYKPHTGDPFLDEPRAFCLPSGFPSAYFGPYPVQIVQNGDWLVMVTEFERATRLIPLDGRPHREGIEPTYLRRSRRTLGGRHARNRHAQLQALDARRLLLRESRRVSDAQRRVSHDRKATARRREHVVVRVHGRGSEDLHAAMDRAAANDAASGVGRGRALRVPMPGEQPLSRR